MLNYIWAAFVLLGILVAVFTNNLSAVTNGVVTSAVDAVGVCVRMLGIVAMWSGLMRVAEKSGLVAALARKAYPLLRFLFPSVPKDSKAMEYIAANFIANVLGLGWAATPAGLSAMSELQKLSKNRDKTRATVDMCTFLIINMSSLQLVTVNLLAYRAQYGSANPSEIIGPGLLSTIVSSVVAVMVVKLFARGAAAAERGNGEWA